MNNMIIKVMEKAPQLATSDLKEEGNRALKCCRPEPEDLERQSPSQWWKSDVTIVNVCPQIIVRRKWDALSERGRSGDNYLSVLPHNVIG